MSFSFMVNFRTTVDENGSMTWTVTQDKISILYYSNNENINLENIFSLLNNSARTYEHDIQVWKLRFTMQVSDSEHWNYDYFKRIQIICRNDFYFFSFIINNNIGFSKSFLFIMIMSWLFIAFSKYIKII